MTSTDIALRNEATLPQKIEFARFLAKADLLPKAYQDKPANLLYAVEYGELLGLHPMAAITGINIIDGKPSISAGLIAALVRRAGHKIRVQSTGDGKQAKARCQITRADDPGFTYSATWDMDRAEQAGLLHKTNWQKYPLAMLKARATSECARDACQEVLLGIAYTADELGAEDEGGEILHDGWPTLPSGQVDAAQMSDQARDKAGLMTTRERVEHAELRGMNKVNPGDLERMRETPEDDPWYEPDRPPRKASAKAEKNLADMLISLDLGPQQDVWALFEWILGKPYQATAKQVSDLTKWLESHLAAENVQGDFDKARDAIWQQYQAAHPRQESGDGDA